MMEVSGDLHKKVKQIRGAGIEKPKRVTRRPQDGFRAREPW